MCCMLSEVTFLLLVYHKFLTTNMSTRFTLTIKYVFMTVYWFSSSQTLIFCCHLWIIPQHISQDFCKNTSNAFLLAHAVHQATTLRAWSETLCTRWFSVLQYLLHLVTVCQFGIKIVIKAGQSRDQILVEARISMPSQPAVWHTQPPAQWVLGSFLGVKQLEPGADHPSPPGTKVRNG